MNSILYRHIQAALKESSDDGDLQSPSELPELDLNIINVISANLFSIGLMIQDGLGVDIPQAMFDLESYVEELFNIDTSQYKPTSEAVEALEGIIADNDKETLLHTFIVDAFDDIESELETYNSDSDNFVNPDLIHGYIIDTLTALGVEPDDEDAIVVDVNDDELAEADTFKPAVKSLITAAKDSIYVITELYEALGIDSTRAARELDKLRQTIETSFVVEFTRMKADSGLTNIITKLVDSEDKNAMIETILTRYSELYKAMTEYDTAKSSNDPGIDDLLKLFKAALAVAKSELRRIK